MQINSTDFYSFEFHFKITESLKLPYFKGNLIRGIMGNALKEIFCIELKQKECLQCSQKFQCPFVEFFLSIHQNVSSLPERYQKYSNFPSRYCINSPENKKTDFLKNETLTFQFNFMGNIQVYLPLITNMLEKMKDFKPDYKSNGRFKLLFIRNKMNQKNIYENGKLFLNNLKKYPLDFAYKNGNNLFQLNFTTPTRILNKGKYIGKTKSDKLTGEILTQRIWEKAMLLLLLYSDHNEIPEVRKDAIKIISQNLRWEEYNHRTFRQNDLIKLGGFIGIAKIMINDPEIYQYLKLLEFMHLGSNVKAGYGKYVMKRIDR